MRPPPSAERALLLLAQKGPGAARDRFVESYLPLIATMGRGYRRPPAIHLSEVTQAGVAGLMRALERYDPQLGTPFWAYASWWVRQAMQQLVAEITHPVVLSDRAQRQVAHARHAQRTFRQIHGREPSRDEIAATAGLSTDQVAILLLAERRPNLLDEENHDDETAAGPGALVPEPRAEDAFDRARPRVTAERRPQLFDRLSDREQSILRARYGLDGHAQSLGEVGRTLGVSAERVRQIEHGALDKLGRSVG